MEEENNRQFELSMQSDASDLTLLKNICDSEHEYNDWVRTDIDGIVIDMSQHYQISPYEAEANVNGGNDIESDSK